MANPLTGDFESVLQVSGATVNRLLASIHQNHGLKNELPKFPHSIRLRIGDPNPIEGMKGTAWAQASVPRIELIHGSEDRFRLEVGVRVRYVADPGTTPLPELIHGTVRAEYQLQSIDPDCRGWRTRAAEYLWIRVVGSTVSFTGTAVNDTNFFSLIEIIDEAAIDARITRLLRRLLQSEFAPTPHRVSKRFRRGSMRSLNLGFNQSLVVVPVSLTGGTPYGNIASVNQDLLEGNDFAIGISGEAIVARIQPALDNFRASFYTELTLHHRTYIDLGFLGDVDVVTVTITWGIKITSATVQWFGGSVPFFGGWAGGVIVTIAGEARTQKSVFNLNFNATVVLELVFDPANERFVLAQKGSPVVSLSGTFAAVAEPHAKPRIINEITTHVANTLAQVGDQLSLKAGKKEMVDQLKTIDAQADAVFEQVVFTPDGVLVRGRIYVGARRPPVHTFVKMAEENGFSAFESWIPGGRIDALEWSWDWWNNAHAAGKTTHADRFLLRRPPAKQGKFGAMIGLTQPLPGLDGMGRICLRVRGVHVHPVTGELVPASTTRRCLRFGYDIHVYVPNVGRLFLRELEPRPRDPIGPVAERALVEVGGQYSQAPRVNTLVIFVGDEWNREHQGALRDGLAASQRRDAGLLVLVLFRDGVLMRRGAELMPELSRFAAELEAPLVVNEDVHGGWSKALSVETDRSGTEWRLVTSTGGVSWSHSGPATSRELAQVLDDYLFAGADPSPQHFHGGISPGSRVVGFEAGLIGDLYEHLETCPPPPVGTLGLESMVVFAQKESLDRAAIEKLVGRTEGDSRLVTVIVDGADLRDIDALKSNLPDDVVLIPDAHGAIANRFGVRGWPTSVALSEQGVVTAVNVGRETDDRQPESEEAL